MDAAAAGDRIRARRHVLGITQAELAERVGVHPSSVISWESGRHFPRRYRGKIEAVLGVSLAGERPAPRDSLAGRARRIEALAREIAELEEAAAGDDEARAGRRAG